MRILTCLFIIFTLTFITAGPAGAGELVLFFEDKENYPEELGNSIEIDREKPGAAVEFFKAVGDSLSLKIKFKRAPWKRCLETELKNGTADGVFECGYQKEREDFGVFPMKNGELDLTRRYSTKVYYFYKIKGAGFSWNGKKAINFSKNIGTTHGYSIIYELKKMGCEAETSQDTITAFKKLLSGRLSAVAALEGEGDHLLKKHAYLRNSIEKVEPPIVERHYFLILSRQFVSRNPKLAEKIWDRTGELRKTLLPVIMKKYCSE